MSLRHIRAFLAVVDMGNFRAAAQALGISQPAVSKSIQALEADFGVTLLHRSRSGVRLSPYGQTFLARARLVLNEIERAHGDFAQLGADAGGRIALAVAPSVAELLVPIVLPRFRQAWPKVTIHILGGLPSATLQRLTEGAMDFVIGPRPTGGVPKGVDSWCLFSTGVAITVRSQHPLRHAKSLREFAGAEWVLTRSAANAAGPLTRALATLGLPPPVAPILTESSLTTQALLSRSDYVGLMPSRVLEQTMPGDGSILRDALVAIDVPELFINNSVELFFRDDVPLTPAALALAQGFVQASQSRGAVLTS